MRASGVEGGAPWALRWSTLHSRSALGHKIGSPDALCPIIFPLNPFCWFVNGSMTNLESWRFPAVAVVSKMLRPQLKAVSLRRNGVISDLGAVYSLCPRRKK